MGVRATIASVLREHGGPASRRGLLAGLVVFLLLAGAGVSYAAWTSTVTATSTASVASLTLTTANFSTNAYTFQNHLVTTTGSVTIANTTTTTSNTVPSLTLDFDISAGNATLAAGIQLRVWPSTLGACVAGTATPGAAVAGTFADFPAIVTTLAKSTSVTYCVRSFGADRSDLGTSTGTATITGRVSATLTVSNFTTTATATTTQGTQHIYPDLAPDEFVWYNILTTENPVRCLRVSNTAIIESSCSTANSRQWRFMPTGDGYYDVQGRSSTARRWDNNASTTSGAAVTLRNDNDSLLGQEWQMQEVSAGVYQFVNNLSGLCLQTATAAAAQVTCAGTTAQRYTLAEVTEIAHIDDLSCTDTGTTGTSRRVRYDWDPDASSTYSIQYRSETSTGNWTQVATIAAGATSFTWSTGLPTPGSTGTWDVRIVVGTSTSAATVPLETESVYRGNDGTVHLRCLAP